MHESNNDCKNERDINLKDIVEEFIRGFGEREGKEGML